MNTERKKNLDIGTLVRSGGLTGTVVRIEDCTIYIQPDPKPDDQEPLPVQVRDITEIQLVRKTPKLFD